MAEGILVDITFSENLAAALRQGAAAGRDLSPAMKEIAAYLERVHRMRFETETGPDGRRWKPSERARDEGGRTLTLSGDLASSIGSGYGPAFAEVGPERSFGAAVYAAIHQFGGTIRAKAGRALSFGGRIFASVTIPARPYVGFSDADQDEMTEILTGFLRRAFASGGAAA